jgi:hypothetical protein
MHHQIGLLFGFNRVMHAGEGFDLMMQGALIPEYDSPGH